MLLKNKSHRLTLNAAVAFILFKLVVEFLLLDFKEKIGPDEKQNFLKS